MDIHDDLAACDDDDALREKLRNFPEYLDMIRRQWLPMAANGRQWPPTAANGYQCQP